MIAVDYIIAVRQAALEIVGRFYVILPIVCSYVPVFAGFLLFLIWNKGIVLGTHPLTYLSLTDLDR
jgi:hypothetical protein